MTAIQRIRVNWSGFVGAPGVSTFYATDAATLIPLLHTYFTALVNVFPNVVRINAELTGDEIESTTGVLTGVWAGGTFAQVSGGSAGVYASPAGVLQRWDTATILSGRKLRGHTFLVPAASTCFDTSGQVLAGTVTTAQAAAAALITAAAGNMLIYQRPRAARAADGSRPAITARGGGYGPVSASRIGSAPAILSSRRD